MSASDTRTCPFCAETIKAAAVVCRFCGRDLPLPHAAAMPVSMGTAADRGETFVSMPGIRQSEIFDLLTALVEKSLVVYEEDEQGRGRYRLLETVRQYARDRLLDAPEGEAVRQRHAAVFLGFAEEIVRVLSRKEPVAWLGGLEREYDNLRVALDWTLGSDPVTALRLAGALGRFWMVRSQLTEGREWLERALEVGRDSSPPLRARVLNWLSGLMHWQGDYSRMVEVLEESRALAQRAGDKESLAFALGGLALEAHLHGHQVRARTLMQECTGLLREANVDDPWLTAAGMVVAAGIAAATATDRPIAEQFREAQAACRATGDPFSIGGCCRTEAFFTLQHGDAGRALALGREGLQAARQVGHTVGVHNALEVIAAACAAQDRPEQTARLLGAAEALREVGQWSILPLWTATCEQAVANARAALGDAPFAAAWAEGRAMSLPQAVEEALRANEQPAHPAEAPEQGYLIVSRVSEPRP